MMSPLKVINNHYLPNLTSICQQTTVRAHPGLTTNQGQMHPVYLISIQSFLVYYSNFFKLSLLFHFKQIYRQKVPKRKRENSMSTGSNRLKKDRTNQFFVSFAFSVQMFSQCSQSVNTTQHKMQNQNLKLKLSLQQNSAN